MTSRRTNPFVSRVLIAMTHHRVPVVHRVLQTVLNCDIGCELPKDTRIGHPFGIVIHAGAKIGRNVVILHQVTIGERTLDSTAAAPRIGDNVYIGAGAKVLGDITVGDGARIGANAVVTKDVPPGATVVGYNVISRS
ncbi:MAG: serine acetyltransferase [Deltaproteobacteria bacterium]|nr:serine acetyltransferase [Deltaproteobacteria bacterium]